MTDVPIDSNPKLRDHIQNRLAAGFSRPGWHGAADNGYRRQSAVFMGLTHETGQPGQTDQGPFLVLNKRSEKVRQPGDLCYPGGGIRPMDRLLPVFLRLPGLPLSGHKTMQAMRLSNPASARRVSVLLATSLRESWEEMRLNPIRVRFLGVLPVQKLVMFEHMIHPLVGWIPSIKRLKPNWEVARIVPIPLRKLLKKNHYALYRLRYRTTQGLVRRDFPCFVHEDSRGRELLWGASFRITMDFMALVFGFNPPDERNLPVMEGRLGDRYLNGSRLSPVK